MMKLVRACLVFPLLLGVLVGIHLFVTKTDYKRTCLRVGDETLEVRVAETPEELERGLSVVGSLKEGEGMLFVFEKEVKPVFHVGSIRAPCDVAFINEKGRILNIERLDPKKAGELHPAPGRTRYALEVPSGWFEKKRVKAGSRIQGNRQILKNGESCIAEGIA